MDSLNFYNNFDHKLLKDYATANKRIKSAIENLSVFIPTIDECKVLDIGCGIGWSTFEFSRFFPNHRFLGIDLSPVLISKASTLFQSTNLEYAVFDISTDAPREVYDTIVMIDVYEHIPIAQRQSFHTSLSKLLKPNGRLILACPSVYHQNYLKENKPEGLQPVDEDVTSQDLINLATDIGGELIFFEFQNIWRTYDYFYAVIQRGVRYNSDLTIKRINLLKVEEKQKRHLRLNKKLGYKIDVQNSLMKKIVKKLRP